MGYRPFQTTWYDDLMRDWRLRRLRRAWRRKPHYIDFDVEYLTELEERLVEAQRHLDAATAALSGGDSRHARVLLGAGAYPGVWGAKAKRLSWKAQTATWEARSIRREAENFSAVGDGTDRRRLGTNGH